MQPENSPTGVLTHINVAFVYVSANHEITDQVGHITGRVSRLKNIYPEAVVGEIFGQYINRQRVMRRLDRIVVDECHVALDSLNGFRSWMLVLGNLIRAETQMVCLAATLIQAEAEHILELYDVFYVMIVPYRC
jgi:hypothetical protein